MFPCITQCAVGVLWKWMLNWERGLLVSWVSRQNVQPTNLRIVEIHFTHPYTKTKHHRRKQKQIPAVITLFSWFIFMKSWFSIYNSLNYIIFDRFSWNISFPLSCYLPNFSLQFWFYLVHCRSNKSNRKDGKLIEIIPFKNNSWNVLNLSGIL